LQKLQKLALVIRKVQSEVLCFTQKDISQNPVETI